MLNLTLYRDQNRIEMTVPPSDQPMRIVISLERERQAHLGFIAPDAVTIMRSDARHVRHRMQARRRTMLKDELR